MKVYIFFDIVKTRFDELRENKNTTKREKELCCCEPSDNSTKFLSDY